MLSIGTLYNTLYIGCITMEEQDNSKFRMSIDYARRSTTSPKIKITATGNTKEEFEANLVYLEQIALTKIMM